MKTKKSVMFLFLAASLLANRANAYLDPGTGGVIIGSIWPLILAFFTAVGAFFVKWFWKPIKGFFLKLIGKKDNR